MMFPRGQESMCGARWRAAAGLASLPAGAQELGAVGAQRAAHQRHERDRAAGADILDGHRLRPVRGGGEGRPDCRRRPAGPLPGAALDGDDVFMEFKSRHVHQRRRTGRPRPGTRSGCTGSTATWRRSGRSRATGSRSPTASPPTARSGSRSSMPRCAGSFIYVPGAGGSIFKVNKTTGAPVARINPFGATLDPDTFTVGPLTADAARQHLLQRHQARSTARPGTPTWSNSWLVKVAPNGTVADGDLSPR